MITFKDFIAEAYKRRTDKNNAKQRFAWDVEDALWDELKSLKIPKQDIRIGVQVSDSWQNLIFDKLGVPYSKGTTRDFVSVQLTPESGRRIEQDIELLKHVLPKRLEKVLNQFFERVEVYSGIGSGIGRNSSNGLQTLFMRWETQEPKWTR
jgi:hypothetical protein